MTADGLVAVTVVPSSTSTARAGRRQGLEGAVPTAPGSTGLLAGPGPPQDGRGLGQGQDDGVQGQAHASSHHCPVDADELQVAS
jgi:hypothetical protein